MILSEKITMLRKQSGLSQEQFGDKIGVSRQAVSKWEMAQSLPDIPRLKSMAEFFGVSLDYLLNDEQDVFSKTTTAEDCHQISLEEGRLLLEERKKCAKRLCTAAALFVVSPVAGILLSTMGSERLGILGAMIQVAILTVSAALAVHAFGPLHRQRQWRREAPGLSDAGKEFVLEQKQGFAHRQFLGIFIGVILFVASVLPLMACAMFTENDMAIAFSGSMMLWMIAMGLASILYVAVIHYGHAWMLENAKKPLSNA